MVCQPVCEIIHSHRLVDHLLIQAAKPWYNFYSEHLFQENDENKKYFLLSCGDMDICIGKIIKEVGLVYLLLT